MFPQLLGPQTDMPTIRLRHMSAGDDEIIIQQPPGPMAGAVLVQEADSEYIVTGVQSVEPAR